MKLFIVESPGKVKKIQSYLGSTWKVLACCGHVRRLSKSGKDKLGFELSGSTVRCEYETLEDKLKGIRGWLKKASEVYIGTDGDREGETIGWHLVEALKLRRYKRVVYREITQRAILESVQKAGTLNLGLVNAGRCRDCLDKLIGYRLSPAVWELGAKSVGRVQTPTLHFLSKREREIQAFQSRPYWVLSAVYGNGLVAKREETFASEALAEAAKASAARARHEVKRVIRQEERKSPPLAFTTSTLQQAAGERLKWSPAKTMQVAQQLYEGGYITYMRTDSTVLSETFLSAAQAYLQQRGVTGLRPYQGRQNKRSQEAHEAIRPTGFDQVPPSREEQLLYGLIEQRTWACLCSPARVERTEVRIVSSDGGTWVARGQRVLEPGYTVFWNNLAADTLLPAVVEGEELVVKELRVKKEKTQPPPRYTEAKTVEKMEKLGIGRPSTYASTVATLKERGYIEVDGQGHIHVTPLGLTVDEYMTRLCSKLVEPTFTEEMESELDQIASGAKAWEPYLHQVNAEINRLLQRS